MGDPMASHEHQSDFSLPVYLGDIRRRQEERARAEGFANLEEQEAHERAADEAAAELERQALARKRRESLIRSVGDRVTDDVRTSIVEGRPLGDTDAWRAVQAWLTSSQPAIILAGPTGSGKTVAAIRALADWRGSTQFVRALRIGAHFERWSSDREDKIMPLDVGVGLLVVDDLGQEPLDDRRSLPALEEIVDARQSARTRTIFTTNLTAEQYGARYSDRMRSRLFQAAGTLTTIHTHDLRRAR